MKSNVLDGQPINGSAPAAPSKRGDVIACGVFDGTNGMSVCWCDYVSDETLYSISKGGKGWSTARTGPRRLSDKAKERQLRLLQNYVFSKIVCGLNVGGQS